MCLICVELFVWRQSSWYCRIGQLAAGFFLSLPPGNCGFCLCHIFSEFTTHDLVSQTELFLAFHTSSLDVHCDVSVNKGDTVIYTLSLKAFS